MSEICGYKEMTWFRKQWLNKEKKDIETVFQAVYSIHQLDMPTPSIVVTTLEEARIVNGPDTSLKLSWFSAGMSREREVRPQREVH